MESKRVVTIVLGVMFVLGGLTAGTLGWLTYQDTQSDLENAVETEGTVVNTSIAEEEREVDTDDDGLPERTETEYRPVVRYTYTYEGQEFTSASVYPGGERSFDSYEGAANVTGQFDAGESVTVKVNADDPSSAFLLAEESSVVVLAVAGGAGLLCLLIGGSVLRRGFTGDA